MKSEKYLFIIVLSLLFCLLNVNVFPQLRYREECESFNFEMHDGVPIATCVPKKPIEENEEEEKEREEKEEEEEGDKEEEKEEEDKEEDEPKDGKEIKPGDVKKDEKKSDTKKKRKKKRKKKPKSPPGPDHPIHTRKPMSLEDVQGRLDLFHGCIQEKRYGDALLALEKFSPGDQAKMIAIYDYEASRELFRKTDPEKGIIIYSKIEECCEDKIKKNSYDFYLAVADLDLAILEDAADQKKKEECLNSLDRVKTKLNDDYYEAKIIDIRTRWVTRSCDGEPISIHQPKAFSKRIISSKNQYEQIEVAFCISANKESLIDYQAEEQLVIARDILILSEKQQYRFDEATIRQREYFKQKTIDILKQQK